jgi:hypothetical protein
MKRNTGLLMLLICLILVGSSCTYKLSLNGASIPPKMKTIRVDFFENNAALVVNNLSTQFTEALKNRIRNTTSLSIVAGETADATMSGSITGYEISPISVNAVSTNVAPIAGASQLTITVNVKYVSKLDKNYDFESSFSKSLPFKGDINSQEQTLITAINKQLTEDIFNKAFANW